MKRLSTGDKVFEVFNYFFLIVIFLIVLLPLIFVVSASVSDPAAVMAGEVWFWPVGLNFEAYGIVMRHERILVGYRNTILYTTVGTFINIVMTIFAAYPLSRPNLKGRTAFLLFMIFTMYFNGGLIPTFLTIRNLGMLDTFWVMVIPVAITTVNVIIMRTFFINSIPSELHDAAEIDGCTNIQTLVLIVLPLSKAVISVLVLWYAVAHWNSFFNALIYLSSPERFPLQLVLRDVLVMGRPLEIEGMTPDDIIAAMEQQMRGAMLQYAVIIVANLPVLMIYPFIQKYFVKGIMIGSVKG